MVYMNIMLGLDKTDQKILKIISKKPSYLSEIARESSIWRTTIQYRLKRLEKIGLVKKNKKGIKSIWQRVYKKDWNKNIFKIYTGKEIFNAYNHFLKLPKESVILAIQGVKAAEGELCGIPPSFIQMAHHNFKKRKIIIKSIINEEILNIFNLLKKEMIKSHIGRGTGIKIITHDKLLLGYGEIMATPKLTLLGNLLEKRVVLIKDKNIAQILYETLEILFDAFEEKGSFDLNKYLKELANRK